MDFDATNMTFDRTHRLGSDKAKKPRTIFDKFHYFTERQQERLKSYDENIKATLKVAERGEMIQRQLPFRGARRAFQDIIKEEEENGHSIRIHGFRLFV